MSVYYNNCFDRFLRAPKPLRGGQLFCVLFEALKIAGPMMGFCNIFILSTMEYHYMPAPLINVNYFSSISAFICVKIIPMLNEL
jgi:hypothetical protein